LSAVLDTMGLYAGRSTAEAALEQGGFAFVYIGRRLRRGVWPCFLEGVGVLEEVYQGVEAFAGAEDESGR
jgi:hypothetical protein